MRKFLKDYVNNIEDKIENCNNAIITGSCGTGKTYLCRCFLNDLKNVNIEVQEKVVNANYDGFDYKPIKRKIKTLIITIYDLISDLRKKYKNEPIDRDYKDYDLLVIDEVGVQFDTDAERQVLYDIINYRWENYKPTFIISNYKLEDKNNTSISKVLGMRITDRLIDGATVINLEGQSWRTRQNG